jgi:VWFA-related protein
MKCALLIAMCLAAFGASTEGPWLNKLNVVALDIHGQPATDLSASDFQLFEDGKPKQITYFRFTGGKVVKAEPGEFSNRSGTPKHTTVILVDLLSDRLLSDSVVGKEVAETLKKLETSDDVFLYFLTNHGEVFPIRGLEDAGRGSWTQNAGPMIDLAVKKLYGIRPMEDRDPAVRFNLTFAALNSLGGQMQQIAGRKSLIWVTHGVPLYYRPLNGGQLVDLTRPFQVIAERLERSQIVIYAVQQSLRGAGEALVTEGGQSLELFTGLTGGRIYRTDNADTALAQAKLDARANYQIAYYSETAATDGKRHKLRVTCSRKDIRLLTEQEFHGLEPTQSPDFEQLTYLEAARSPIDDEEIGLRATVSRIPGETARTFHLTIDREDLLLHDAKGKVSVAFAIYGGRDDGRVTQPMPVDVSATATGTIAFQQRLAIDPAINKVRAIVVDSERGAVGSVTIPLSADGR